VHGGMTPVEHGLYSKYKGALIGDRVKELVDDPDLLDMRKHIAILVGLEQNFLKIVEDTGIINAATRREIRDIEEAVTKAIQRLQGTKIELGGKVEIEDAGKKLLARIDAISKRRGTGGGSRGT
jgi:hypothetical protein